MAEHSGIVRPWTDAVRAASLSRLPPHSSQAVNVAIRSTNALTWACRSSACLSMNTRRTLTSSPS